MPSPLVARLPALPARNKIWGGNCFHEYTNNYTTMNIWSVAMRIGGRRTPAEAAMVSGSRGKGGSDGRDAAIGVVSSGGSVVTSGCGGPTHRAGPGSYCSILVPTWNSCGGD